LRLKAEGDLQLAVAQKEINKMGTPVIGISDPTASPARTQSNPGQNTSLDRVADKRADAVRAKKKKKREAHRVALRRSHTKG
jgi:hypothetical protein